MSKPENPPAFPKAGCEHDCGVHPDNEGMTLRDWFAGQALANPSICTGQAAGWELEHWFGNRTGITRAEIVSKQAYVLADAMLAERAKGESS